MYFYLAIGILITCYLLFLIWLFSESPANVLKVNELKISKRRFVLLVLHWCQENLEKTQQQFDLKIYYYPNRKYLGKFQSYNKQIIIYINPDMQLIELTDTIIHEYIHFLQFMKKSAEQDYNKKLVQNGYWDNPYEVHARRIASLNRDECLKWILKNNQVY